jgi:hypothetical protein
MRLRRITFNALKRETADGHGNGSPDEAAMKQVKPPH